MYEEMDLVARCRSERRKRPRLSRNRWRSSAPSRAPELEALRASVEEHKKATADMKTSIGSIEAAVEDTVTRLVDDLGDQGDADMRCGLHTTGR